MGLGWKCGRKQGSQKKKLMAEETHERFFDTPESEREGDMLYRTLGRTGERVSLIGLGGHHNGRIFHSENWKSD